MNRSITKPGVKDARREISQAVYSLTRVLNPRKHLRRPRKESFAR